VVHEVFMGTAVGTFLSVAALVLHLALIFAAAFVTTTRGVTLTAVVLALELARA
jgi:H+/Cl- antiporter ClcA